MQKRLVIVDGKEELLVNGSLFAVLADCGSALSVVVGTICQTGECHGRHQMIVLVALDITHCGRICLLHLLLLFAGGVAFEKAGSGHQRISTWCQHVELRLVVSLRRGSNHVINLSDLQAPLHFTMLVK